jgi:tetratricopeptide (TPR) repeat protein
LSKHFDEVKSALNTALKLRREAFGDEHPWTALVVSNMGEYLMLIGQPVAALDNHRIALRIRERILGKNHPDTAMSLNNLGAVLYSQQEFRQSSDAFARAVSINTTLFGDKHPQTLLTKLNLAVNDMALGDFSAAEVWLKQIVATQEEGLPLPALQITALVKLGDTQVVLNNLAQAQTQYLRVLDDIAPSDRDAQKANTRQAFSGLSQVYARQGQAALARTMMKTYPWAIP